MRRARTALSVLVLLVALATSGSCGKKASKPSGSDCEKGCAHLLGLARTPLGETAAGLPDDVRDKLSTLAEKFTGDDPATCVAKCQSGQLDTTCVLAAKSFDRAATCIRAPSAATAPSGKLPTEDLASLTDDWVAQPLTATDGEVGGVRFTVQLPQGLTRVRDGDHFVRWEVAAGDPFNDPAFQFTVRDRFPATAEEGLAMIDPKGPPPSGPVILDNQLSGDRYRLMHRNPGSTFVEVYVLHRTAAGALECKANQSKRPKLPEIEAIGARFLEICAGVVVRQ